MKISHTITVEELDEWMRTPQWKTFASSFSSASNKVLAVDAASDGPVFVVRDHGETKFLGTDRTAAITAYNAAP